jgi:glyoxylase-like metal-dependent hydrolase (beta-lactamase superfamily II)
VKAEGFPFDVGAIECVALNDGTNVYKAAAYFPSAPAAELEQAFREHGVQPDNIPSPYTCMAVKTAEEWVLLDTGAGRFVPTTGRLPLALASAGIAPEAVSTVIITHAHPDHIGGNVDDAGRVAFPNARWVMWRDEWDYWTSPAARAQPPIFTQCTDRNLPPIADRLVLVDRETEVAPGVFAVPALGHTPGHMVVAVASRGEESLYISDTVLHPIHLEHPEWQPVFDMDPSLAVRSTRRIFDRAVERRSLVLAFHFDPFPSLGHIAKQGAGWRWQPMR